MIHGNLRDGLMPPPGDSLVFMPALHSGRGRTKLSGHGTNAAELLKDTEIIHEVRLSHKSAHSQVRQTPFFADVLYRKPWAMESSQVIEALKRLGVRHEDIAHALGRERSVATKLLSGGRALKANEMPALLALIGKAERDAGEDFVQNDNRDYLPIEILPTFGGMGGGGTGDGDPGFGLIPRRVIEDELHGNPADFLLIDTRGDSAMPDFMHGDQILIDKRDRNPVQPGSFALWDGDGYVIKLVERVSGKRGYYRIFSSNARYSAYEMAEDDITIMGRPVWFARRL